MARNAYFVVRTHPATSTFKLTNSTPVPNALFQSASLRAKTTSGNTFTSFMAVASGMAGNRT